MNVDIKNKKYVVKAIDLEKGEDSFNVIERIKLYCNNIQKFNLPYYGECLLTITCEESITLWVNNFVFYNQKEYKNKK